MQLEEFENYVKGHAENRPEIAYQTRRIIRKKFRNRGDYLSDERFFLEMVEKKTGQEKATKSYKTNTKKRRSADSELDAYQQILKDWSRKKPKPTGDWDFAVATFYYYFRYLNEPSYFVEIAKKTWNINSELYKRFYFAKKGGSPDDDFEVIVKRFVAENALEQYAKIAIVDKILQPHLTIETSEGQLHYSQPIMKVLGRNDEQKRLHSFLKGGSGFKWLQLSGVGGQGKSRLAFDLVSEVTSTWFSGFLLENELSAFKTHWKEWQPTRPTLIVIDYILGHEPNVKEAFQILAKRSEEFDKPVRLLLVERQRWDRGGLIRKPMSQIDRNLELELSTMSGKAEWFLALCHNTPEGSDSVLSSTRFEDGVIELETLSADHLVTITRRIAESENKEITLDDEKIKVYLDQIDRSGRPLFAYLLGQALSAGKFQADWDQNDLLSYTVARDYDKRWSHVFEGSPPLVGEDTPAMRLAVLATMVERIEIKSINWPDKWQGFDRKDRRGALALVDGPMGHDARIIGVLPGLQPDILGEWFVLSCLAEEMNLQTLTQLAWSTAPNKMAAFLQRCTQDFPHREEVFQLLEIEPNHAEGQANYISVSPIIANDLISAGCKKHPDQLVKAVESATKIKDKNAMNIMAYYSYMGIGVAKHQKTAFEWWWSSAKAGNSSAMANLGICYRNSIGVDHDPVKAVEWYRKGAEAGSGVGMLNLGIAYQRGDGIDACLTEAVEWFHRAVEIGECRGMVALGVCYEDGIGVNADPVEAMEWYRKAAKAGDSTGMFNLGNCYINGIGVNDNPAKAAEWFREAAEAGNDAGMLNLGLCYKGGVGVSTDLAAAAVWYRRAAETGNCRAMIKIGICYASGSGVDADPAEAVEWYHKAAKAGDCTGMFNLGVCYANGNGVDADLSVAVEWYRKAAAESDSQAMVNLGMCYEHGIGVDADSAIAVSWYRKAAKVGDSSAMVSLGVCCANGTGTKVDPVESMGWFRKAAEAGSSSGMVNLGMCYANGTGTNADLSEMAKWFRMAAEAGDSRGMTLLSKCYLQGIGVDTDLEEAMRWLSKATQDDDSLRI